MAAAAQDDLVFAENDLIESLVDAVANRPAGTPPADAIVKVLVAAIDPARVRAPEFASPRLWERLEDRVTAVLAREAGGAATPPMRAHAMLLAGLVRLATSDEVRRRVAARQPGRAAANELKAILWSAAEAVNRAYP
jgi:hypothetical protein